MKSLQSSRREAHRDTAEAAQAGRCAAFERQYAESRPYVYNLAARILGDPDQAADVTQDVFLTAFSRMSSLPPDVDMERWLHRVAVNTCLDLLRRKRFRGAPSRIDLDQLQDHGDLLERAELTRAIELALADLSPRHRTALVLRDLLGLDNVEVAEIMGVSRSSAGVLIFRARASFRRAFARAAPDHAGTLAGLGLAVLLPALPLPASLQSPPPVGEAGLTAAAPASTTTAPACASWTGATLPAAGAGPAASGLLMHLGTALATKAAVACVGACAVIGGGIAAGAADVTKTSVPVQRPVSVSQPLASSHGATTALAGEAVADPATGVAVPQGSPAHAGAEASPPGGTDTGAEGEPARAPAGGSGGAVARVPADNGGGEPERAPAGGSGGDVPGAPAGAGSETHGSVTQAGAAGASTPQPETTAPGAKPTGGQGEGTAQAGGGPDTDAAADPGAGGSGGDPGVAGPAPEPATTGAHEPEAAPREDGGRRP